MSIKRSVIRLPGCIISIARNMTSDVHIAYYRILDCAVIVMLISYAVINII